MHQKTKKTLRKRQHFLLMRRLWRREQTFAPKPIILPKMGKHTLLNTRTTLEQHSAPMNKEQRSDSP